MSHLPNHEEFKDVGQDKPVKDVTDKYDKTYGAYEQDHSGKPTSAGPGTLPNTPSPFTLHK